MTDQDLYGGRHTVYIGEDRTFTLSPATGEEPDITGQTFEVRIVDDLQIESTVTIEHADLDIDAEDGVIVAAHSFSDLRAGLYRVELWRVDSGEERKRAWFHVELIP